MEVNRPYAHSRHRASSVVARHIAPALSGPVGRALAPDRQFVELKTKKPRDAGFFQLGRFKNYAPVTKEIVTVPMVMLLITTEPLALITTGKFLPEEFRVPSTNLTSRSFADPFALPPDVATFRLQGLTRTDWPIARGEPAGKVEAVTVKMQEPNVVGPVAVAPPALIANAGVAVALVKATVVGVVVPKSGTPDAKVKG